MSRLTTLNVILLTGCLATAAPLLCLAQVIRQAVYVDATAGNDENTGFSPGEAWKTLERVNAATFGPGASILFRAGGIWRGQLSPRGSGSEGRPVVIDRYGKGGKPLISGAGMTGEGVVRLFNQSYWEINNLEITNDAEEAGDRRGIEIKAADFGTVQHIHLKDLEIHHIKGIPGNSLTSKLTAGIYIAVTADSLRPTRFNDLLIERCEIHHVDNQGIVTNNEVAHNDYPGTPQWHRRKFTDVRIRDNVIHHIAKNAMIIRLTEGGVVEHNLCYETALKTTGNTIFSRSASGTVFQYNEGYLNRSPDYDGSLYDPDLSSPGTIWQYSYSHDNAHGLVWFCTTGKDQDVIVRYNLSRNDRGSLVYFNYSFESAYVYGNTFVIGEHTAPLIIRENPRNDHTYYFYDNVIHNNSRNARYAFAAAAPSTTGAGAEGVAASGAERRGRGAAGEADNTARKEGRPRPAGVQNRNFRGNIFHGYHPEGEPRDTPGFPGSGDLPAALPLAPPDVPQLSQGSFPAAGEQLSLTEAEEHVPTGDEGPGQVSPGKKPRRAPAGDERHPSTPGGDRQVIARVNGEPLYAREFQREMQAVKARVMEEFCSRQGLKNLPAGFWTRPLDGETPLEAVKAAALKKLTRIKVLQSLMKEKGILENTGYPAFLDSLETTNRLRRNELAGDDLVRKDLAGADLSGNGLAGNCPAGKKIVYGLRQYNEKDYFYYVFTNAVLQLKERLLDEKFTGPERIDEAVARLTRKRVEEADVSLDKSLYDQLSFNRTEP